jgi:hypothetical protein
MVNIGNLLVKEKISKVLKYFRASTNVLLETIGAIGFRGVRNDGSSLFSCLPLVPNSNSVAR